MSIDTRIKSIAQQRQLEFADIEFGAATRRSNVSFTSAGVENHPELQFTQRRYLVASITKPVVAMALLKLAAEGQLSLSERIGHLVPLFARANYRKITVRHLLTHTSGFPDMVPNNVELRKSNAPLSDFLEVASKADTEFVPATNSRYSSVGFLILGEIIQRLTSMSTGEFLQRELFRPLQMLDSELGQPQEVNESDQQTAFPCQLPVWQPDVENKWGWNSDYWRALGAPWGGLISTAEDLGKFARMILRGGANDSGRQILPTAVVKAAITNQIQSYADETTFVGSRREWGLGWRMQWPTHQASFGDFVSAKTAGHWGATGTLIWIDPESEKYAVVLTTTPYENSRTAIQQISNLAATS